MGAIPLTQLVPILQLSIGPVILISGVGLMLLTLTNRFGRMLDRARLLNRELAAPATAADAAKVRAQVEILALRARILRRSIALASFTILLAAILVLTLFLSALLKLEDALVMVTIFGLAMISLIGSTLAFIRDVNLSLEAARLELACG